VALFALCTLSVISAATNRVVRVNVLVSDPEGHSIAGLDRGDFSLEDNGEQRTISEFKAFRPPEKLLRAGAAGDGYWISNRPNADNGANRPATVILLDAQSTGPQYQPWSISQMARLIALLGPKEQLAVYQLRQDGLFLLHEFTGNREHLLAAIAPEAMIHNAKTNQWRLDYGRIRVPPAPSPPGVSTYRALERLACLMSRYPERKNLFWISADFPRLFPDEKGTELAADAMAAGRALAAAAVAVFPVDVRSPVPAVPFQPVPPVTGSHNPALNNRQFGRTMNAIAGATGGKAIVNRPELAEAIVDTIRATQRSYELGFEVPAEQLDGGYRELHIQVRRRGLTLLYNHGYFAQVLQRCSPDKQLDNPEIGISVQVSTKSDAMLYLEIRRLGATFRRATRTPAQWQVAVTDADSGSVLATAIGNGLQLDFSLKVPAESRQLRVSVHEEASGRTGTVTLPLDIITQAQMAPDNAAPP
jgi:VWFA-related protein